MDIKTIDKDAQARATEWLDMLKFQAQKKKITMVEIAEKTGLTEATISKTLSGGTMPRFDNLIKIAEVIGMKIDIRDNNASYVPESEIFDIRNKPRNANAKNYYLEVVDYNYPVNEQGYQRANRIGLKLSLANINKDDLLDCVSVLFNSLSRLEDDKRAYDVIYDTKKVDISDEFGRTFDFDVIARPLYGNEINIEDMLRELKGYTFLIRE